MTSGKIAMTSGKAKFKTRARLMLILGEQLITDEIAAVSELIKNSYDADATEVKIKIKDVSKPGHGFFQITDNGHGMTRRTVINVWLELGTIAKARKTTEPPRYSETKKRPYLGEKGLGRLAVHKIGKKTELITRRSGSRNETRLIIDWSKFENTKKYIDDVSVNWENRNPIVFKKDSTYKYERGTQITVSNLHRQWTSKMLEDLQRYVWSMQSPVSALSDFEVSLDIDDVEKPEIGFQDIDELLETAHYKFEANVDNQGFANIVYSFDSKRSYPDFDRTLKTKKDVRIPDEFPEDRQPICGPFTFRIYCWDLGATEKKAAFGDTATYEKMVKPIIGVKLFRDGFRVLPYGNADNDWLDMDQRRIERFQENVSRNQVIGIVEISSKYNPLLRDKSDREGLINNDALRDFRSLIIESLQVFQQERHIDRSKIKDKKKQEKGDPNVQAFSRNMVMLMNILDKKNIDAETRLKIQDLVGNSSEILGNIVEETEEPLLVAASIGLTYMIPTHESRRNIQESIKVLRNIMKGSISDSIKDGLLSVVELLRQTDDVLAGIVRIMQKVKEVETFDLTKPIASAIQLMGNKLERNKIEIIENFRTVERIEGSLRLITILLLNLIDNSIYWLAKNKEAERKLMFTVDVYKDKPTIIVSDNGPGIEYDLDIITRPFFTLKPKGMGLGLYIADRIAAQHNARLELLSKEDFPGILEGANIAILFPSK